MSRHGIQDRDKGFEEIREQPENDCVKFIVTRGMAHCGQIFLHCMQFGKVRLRITLFGATFLLQTSLEVHHNHAGLVLEVSL